RLMQHKKEAYWFYRYLSIFYDKLVNPLFWTKHMRDQALDEGEWDNPNSLEVVDVGSGTGFTTEGIVQRVPASQVSCVDQSPHQMAHAKKKPALEECSFQLGDAEDLPFEDDTFDRYVSAGSIEYWPNPQQGINESYRVIKPGGWALMIGPLEPQQAFSRFIANTWMLFPPDEDYKKWYEAAGFTNIRWRYVKPHWQKNERYGIAIIGQKATPGPSPNAAAVAAANDEVSFVNESKGGLSLGRGLVLFGRVLLGSLAGFIFIPMALIGYAIAPLRGLEGPHEPLNQYQIGVLLVLAIATAGLLWWLL
ncbi:MAG: methyltransferase domain-containing protein, partial [Bacteroidota bacterium]